MSKRDKMVDVQWELGFEKEKIVEMVDQPTSIKKNHRDLDKID
jgi:hypothetical protein